MNTTVRVSDWRAPNLLAFIGIIFLSAESAPSRAADMAADKKRTALAAVRRVAVIAPFFGTATLRKELDPSTEQRKRRPQETENSPNLADRESRPAGYVEKLQRIEEHVRKRLPERMMMRTPFTAVPQPELNAAFRALKLSPEELFQNQGRIRGTKFALPAPEAVRRLAAAVRADAVLLGTLDEPRRVNGRYYLEVTGFAYDSSHVRGKAGYFLLLPDGNEILHSYIEVLHPLSKSGSRDYLLPDWLETEDLIVEDLMDEITRYAPPKTSQDQTKKTVCDSGLSAHTK